MTERTPNKKNTGNVSELKSIPMPRTSTQEKYSVENNG